MDQKYKKTAWLTAGLMLMASFPAYAAGLGKLTVTSALGQPFRGEIDLLAVDKKDLGSLRARFASFEAFKEANIERSPALSAMRFSVEQKKNGDPYLKITSSKPVDEPFLDMLVELDWPAGRLVREYTVLLDPPGYNEQRAEAAPSIPPVSGTPAQAAAAGTPTGAVTPEIRTSIPLDKELLAKEGFDPTYGARPLKRAIQRVIQDPLALKLLAGEFGEGDTIAVDAVKGGMVFRKG